MMKPARTPARKAKTLPQQQVDFTAEGAPPPGRVSTEVPAKPKTPATGRASTARVHKAGT